MAALRPGRLAATRLELLAVASIAILLVPLLHGIVAAHDPAPPTEAAFAATPEQPLQPPLPPPEVTIGETRSAPSGAIQADPPGNGAALMLQGIRRDGKGGGAAIIAGPDGVQRSFAVGDTIAPQIVLKSLGNGFATIARSGSDERLVLSGFATGSAQPVYSTATSQPIPVHPAPMPAGASLKAGASINFADPSTLPTMLTAEAERAQKDRAAKDVAAR